MANLVSKIKDKVHHRRSVSERPPTSEGDSDITEDGPAGVAGTTSPSSPMGHTYVSLENSAFHVHRGPVPRKSKELVGSSPRGQKTSEIATSHIGHRRGASLEERQAQVSDAIPDRDSSRHGTTTTGLGITDASPKTIRVVSTGGGEPTHIDSTNRENGRAILQTQEEMVTEIIPQRASSKQAVLESPQSPSRKSALNGNKPLPSTPGRTASPPFHDAAEYPEANRNRGLVRDEPSSPRIDMSERKRIDSISRKPLRGSGRQSGSDLAQSAELANMYLHQPKSETHPAVAKERALNSGHLRLPKGFSLRDTEQTHVTEEQRPAVTHETIIEQRTEVFTEEITRDVHYHHYYTYVQPIKVVEILPARHFMLDTVTGRKTEIAQPAGWTLPANMIPSSPDTSSIVGWTRHYLVDEEHPTGLPESPVSEHDTANASVHREPGTHNLRQKAVEQRM